MSHRAPQLAALCLFVSLLMLRLSAAPPAPTPYSAASGSALTPDQEKHGWQLATNSCLSCHSADLLAQQRLTPKQWQASVVKMRKWGALLSDTEEAELVTYLSDHFTTSTAAYQIPTISARAAADSIAALPDGPYAHGDLLAGKELYSAKCIVCHGADGRGTIATNLVGRVSLYRAADFADVVRKGRGRMMPFGADMTDAQIAGMIAYLRSLPNPSIAEQRAQAKAAQ